MHVRFLHVCPWFDSCSFLRGPIVFLYLPDKGHLGCFQVLSIENDHPNAFIISDSKISARKNLRGKLYFPIVSEGSARHGVEGIGKGACHSKAA